MSTLETCPAPHSHNTNRRDGTEHIHIMTNQTRKGHPYLLQRAHLLPGWQHVAEQGKDAPSLSPRHLYWGWRLFVESKKFDAVLTGWDHSALVFAILQWLLRRRRKCHVIAYTKWRVPDSRLKNYLRRHEYAAFSFLVDRFLTLTNRQADIHARIWHIPKEKFSVVPYYPTLPDSDELTISDEGYIFAGGDDEKDYCTLLKAIEGLPCKVIIAARFRYHFEGVNVPDNVEILTATHSQFFQLMAGARIVVVPLLDSAVRGGEQTFLNAMLLGKPVIVLSDCGAEEYVTTDESGVVLASGDAVGLRRALNRVLSDDSFRRTLAEGAKKAGAGFSARRYCKEVIDVVVDCVRRQR